MSGPIRTWTHQMRSSVAKVATSLTFDAGINGYSMCQASVHVGDTSGAATPPDVRVASLLGASQRAAFAGGISGFQVSCSVRGGGSISFSGVETMPFWRSGVGSFQPAVAAVHDTSILGRLQMDLYTDAPGAAVDLIQTPNIPERLLGIIKAVVNDWRKSTYPALSDKDKEIALQIHEQNTEPLRVLERILSSSPAFEIPQLEALLSQAEVWHDTINQWILRSLLVGAGDFFAAFVSLIGQLGMVYCPGFDNNGRIVNIGAALDAPADRLGLEGLTVSGSGSMAGDLPVTRIIMERVPFAGQLPSHKPDAKSMVPGQTAPTSLVYPPGVRTGKAMVVDPPAFMSPMMAYARGAAGGVLTPGNARERVAQITEATEKMSQAIRAYLTEVLRNVWRMECLRSSSASVTLPLDFDWMPGTAYRIGVNGELFTGLLARVNHTLSVEPPAASTTLQFSHVQWNGFSVKSLAPS